MRGMLKNLAVLTVLVTACSSGGTPATTPTSVPTTTSTTLPPASTTTTTEATTTTVDRIAEIEAIFQDLEERRLKALYEGNREAFQALFANDNYMTRSMALFDLVEFVADWVLPMVSVSAVLVDSEKCLAADVHTDYSDTLVGGADSRGVEVLEFMEGRWGISYAGEDWACDGPHPLSF